MELHNGYPLVYLDVDADLDSRFKMNALALVDEPATQMDWFAFSATPTYEFASINKEQRMITAPVMLANTPIERFDKKVGKYYTAFTPQSILRMMKKYFVEGKQNNINEMHNGARVVDGVYMVESYIVDERNKTTLFDVEPGSWIATLYVEDEKYWEENIMSGKFKGISLEGSFDTIMDPEQTYATVRERERAAMMLIDEVLLLPASRREKREAIRQIIRALLGNQMFKKWRGNPDSSTVDKILYNDETMDLVIRFHGGGTYTYSNVDFSLGRKILDGAGVCRTEGESRWGSWYVGKSPSAGAAVFTHLVENNYPFKKGGSFFSKHDVSLSMIETIAKSPLRDEDKYDLIKEITDMI